ncbi:glycosyltransferase family 2 protein [Parasalinivibrio latis]|uniref:glycosyltransferase family 2 protein n=1 Tax=Parasalinivibrio latis TaxID=2952610 RepID=UPI0030E1B8CD
MASHFTFSPQKKLSVQVCVMAHNLEDCIQDSLRSLVQAYRPYPARVYVMINGCRDNTLQKVQALANELPGITPVNISLGDKANAWNTFVYEHFDGESIAVFADGDLTFEKAALANLITYFRAHPNYNAVSGYPYDGGRSAKDWQKQLLEKHLFTGGLYLMSPVFLERVRKQNIRLPRGLIGDDSMLGYLTACDLNPPEDDPMRNIGVCSGAVFRYDSLNPMSRRDIYTYLRRRVRYSMRHFQQSTIVPQLKQKGLSAMPATAQELPDITPGLIRWFSGNVVFDLIAYKRLTSHPKTRRRYS